MVFLRKYNTAATIRGLPLVTFGGSDYVTTPTLATGDVKIDKDGGGFNNITTLPTGANGITVISLSATEMSAAVITVKFIDQTSPKEWEDQIIIVESYGNASAQHPFDLASSTVTLASSQTCNITGNITGNLSGSVGSVTGAVGSVTGAVGSVTGNVGGNVTGSVGSVATAVTLASSQTCNITGNLSGSVGSVTGAVGSVTGNVGGNVTGSVGSVVGNVGGNVTGSTGSVVGAVGSVTGNVGGNVVGSVASVTGNVGGDVIGNVQGDVLGSLQGDVVGDVQGTVLGSAAAAIILPSILLDYNPLAPNTLNVGFWLEQSNSIVDNSDWKITAAELRLLETNALVTSFSGVTFPISPGTNGIYKFSITGLSLTRNKAYYVKVTYRYQSDPVLTTISGVLRL